MATATSTASSREEAGFKRKFYQVTDYLLGRNTLIGVASLMLLVLSGYATWHGMRDFIIGVSATPTGQGQNLPGGLSVSNDVLVIVVVAALTFLMWLMLRETFGAAGPNRRLPQRLITFPLYVFLAIWSIGFGYGFWWSLISGEEATRTGLAGLQEDARDASAVIAARLAAVRGQLDSVVSWSEGQMAREDTSGGSCGVPSGAGKGPLYNARRGVRDSVITLRDGMTRSWLDPVAADVEELRKTAAGLSGTTVEERQKAFEAKASEIRGRARNIAARSNQLGRSTAAEMRAIAGAVAIQPNATGFSCYDPTLAERLRQAAAQAEQPAELKLREAVFNEGPAGVANAVKNLWRNIGAYTTSLASYLFTGNPPPARTDSGEPITGRDLIALLATIGVDLGPVGAGHRQPAARRVAAPHAAGSAPHQGGHRCRRGRCGRVARLGPRPFHLPRQRVLLRDPQPLQRSREGWDGQGAEGERSQVGARHEPAGRGAERPRPGALAGSRAQTPRAGIRWTDGRASCSA